jgi:hypothetical protein
MGNKETKELRTNPNAITDKRQYFQNIVVRYKCMNQDMVTTPDRTYNYTYDFGTPRSKVMFLTEGFTMVGEDGLYKSLPPCKGCGGSCPYYWNVVTKRTNHTGTQQGFYTSNGEYKVYNV